MKTKHATVIRSAIVDARKSESHVGGLFSPSTQNATSGSLRSRAFSKAWNTAQAKADHRWSEGKFLA